MEDKELGVVNNSIGIFDKEDLWIDGELIDFNNAKEDLENSNGDFEIADEYFKKGDIVGIGIIHHPNSKLECFATWNGELLGKIIFKK